MPTYQYRCTECGTDLEVVQKFTDAPLTVCPECEGKLRKVYSAVGVVFKGSGFYKTDSRTSSKPAAKEKKAEPAKTESKPAAKTESKPAAKSEAKSV
ncbi:FmdB family zinc ribbon protein [Tessaracoccus massiliensis]|uniref:FmdB family zinc ribbon protein n=1 Tax=Tessaracoccus massiliensis TaxID=1522311 RepID=UPI00058F2318|nr:FmdB family zinc ribbon protein [Tessaracoccus massiliensis]